jgi:hypothetical protein
MTSRGRRQVIVLAVLAAALVAALFAMPRGNNPAGRAGTPSNRAQSKTGAASQQQVADVKLGLLRSQHERMDTPERNPFRFQERVTPSAPEPPPPRTEDVAPEVSSGPPPPPPIALKFIGVLETSEHGGKVAVLSDGHGNTFYGREGAVIDGRYKVVRIGNESAELSYVDGRGRQTLRLSGQ